MSINLNDRVNADNISRDIRNNIAAGAAGASVELLDRMGAGYKPTDLEMTSLKSIAFAAMTAAAKPGDKPPEVLAMNSQQLLAEKNLRDSLNLMRSTSDMMSLHTLMVLNNAHRNIDPEGADEARDDADLESDLEGYEQKLSFEEFESALTGQKAETAFGLQGDPNQAQQMVVDLYTRMGLPGRIPLLEAGPTMTPGPQAPGLNAPGWVPGVDMAMKLQV